MQEHSYSHERIHIRLPNKGIVIDWRIVDQHLPNLITNFTRSQVVDLRNDPLFRNSCSRTAVSYLCTHLKEIESVGGSTALLDSLEDLWKRDRQGYLRGVQSSISTLQVFTALAQLLSADVFGCCETIFSLMSAFFTRHCEEIMRSNSPQWIQYVNALDVMDNGDSMPYLSCLLQHQKDVAKHLKPHCRRRHCSNCLSDGTAWNLMVLFKQKEDRIRRNITEHLGGRRGAAMPIRDGRGGHRIPGGLKNAWEYHPHELLEAQHEGRVYVDESDDNDSDSSSDDDDDYDNYHQHHYLHDTHHHHGAPRRIKYARYPNLPQQGRQGRLMHA